MKWIRPRFGFVVMVGMLSLALPAVAPAASPGPRANGTVIAEVQYRDTAGSLQPLAGVEVFLSDGAAHYACTDATGTATFSGVASNTDLISATGFGVSDLNCANAEFLNPETGRRMFSVFWNNHHGVSVFDNFQVGSNEQTTITFNVRTPANQTTVCGGRVTTIVGTNGPDVIDGRGGNDVINGMGGNDFICGGNGRDTLHGDDGNDCVFGERGKDRLFGDALHDFLFGGPRADRCRTGEFLNSCEL